MAEHGWGPADPSGATAARPDPAPRGVAPSSWGVETDWVPRPMTPATAGTSVDGTAGSRVESRARRPEASRPSTSGSSNAASRRAVVPVTGTRSPSDDVGPTVRPVDASQARVAARVAAVGPKVAPSRPAGR